MRPHGGDLGRREAALAVRRQWRGLLGKSPGYTERLAEMSALGQKRSFGSGQLNVRFAPEADLRWPKLTEHFELEAVVPRSVPRCGFRAGSVTYACHGQAHFER